MAQVSLEDQLAAVRRDMDTLRAELDGQAAKVTATVKAELPSFVKQWMERTVKSEAATIQKLGADGVAQLKREFNEFIASIPGHVDAAYPPSDAWWHRQKLPDDVYNSTHEVTNRNGEGIERRVRDVLSPFGALLVKNGLAEFGYERAWEGSRERPRYRYGLDLPKPIDEAKAQYVATFRKLLERKQAEARLEKEKAERDAKSLWDGA